MKLVFKKNNKLIIFVIICQINRAYIWIHNCSNSSAISYAPSIVRFLIFFVVLSARVVKEKGQKSVADPS